MHDAGLCAAGPQEGAYVGVVAGENTTVGRHQQGDVRVDQVGRVARSKKLTDPLGSDHVQCGDVDAGKDSSKVCLSTTIAPHSGDGASACVNGNPVALEDSQHRPDGAVTPIDGNQGASVENGGHAAPRRRFVLKAAAAALSSSLLNGPCSASQ